MKTFTLEIMTPETSPPVLDVVAVDVPAVEGRLTVLADHAPLICRLEPGHTRVRFEDEHAETWQTGAGTMSVANHTVTLLVTSAAPATQPASPR